jgi:uncharacterized protein YhhL (DUF1145 family)
MSNGNINIHIDKLPESPLFWGVLVPIGIFIGLLATGHIATAIVFFFAVVAIGCLIYNLMADYPSDVVWGICIACAVVALIFGIILVPDDWQTQATKEALRQILSTQIPL